MHAIHRATFRIAFSELLVVRALDTAMQGLEVGALTCHLSATAFFRTLRPTTPMTNDTRLTALVSVALPCLCKIRASIPSGVWFKEIFSYVSGTNVLYR